jgi:hypothetical protein
LAQLAEQLGDFDRALLEYNLALRDQPHQPDILKNLVRLRVEQGDLERAERACRQLATLCPDDALVAIQLGKILRADGKYEEARTMYSDFLARKDDELLKDAMIELDLETRNGPYLPMSEDHTLMHSEEAETTKNLRELPHLQPSDADAIAFAHLFAGREGLYARQWRSDSGKYGYTPVYEPFTHIVARNHLLGSYTVGTYPLRMDNTVLYMAFDLDITRAAMKQISSPDKPQNLSQFLHIIHTFACRIVDVAASHQLTAYIEDSGWKGRHVWIFFNEPLPAAAARRLGFWILELAGMLPCELQVEIFPKQSRLNRDQLGNLIKLPLGIHRVTGRRCLWLDHNAEILPHPLEQLHYIQRADRQHIRNLLAATDAKATWQAQAMQVTQAHQQDSALDGQENDSTDDQQGELSKREINTALPATSPHRNANDLEFQWILRHCPVLRDIAHRAGSSALLSGDEQHVFIYTIGHLSHGAEAVNEVFAGLLNISQQSLLKSPLRGYPMSCPKIRSRLPEISASVECNCEFTPEIGVYPNPLLHLNGIRARGLLATPPEDLSPIQVESMIGDLYRAHRDMFRLQSLIQHLESQLYSIMTTQKIAQLITPAGTISISANAKLTLSLTLSSMPSDPNDPISQNSTFTISADHKSYLHAQFSSETTTENLLDSSSTQHPDRSSQDSHPDRSSQDSHPDRSSQDSHPDRSPQDSHTTEISAIHNPLYDPKKDR